MVSQIYSWIETLHVSDSSSVHHQEFFTVHTAMVYVIQVMLTTCEQDQPVSKLSANLYDIPLLCVQWKTPDDGQRNCPKHVEFHSKNKFEKLVHLVGFIIRNLSRCTVTWASKSRCGVYLSVLLELRSFLAVYVILEGLCGNWQQTAVFVWDKMKRVCIVRNVY